MTTGIASRWLLVLLLGFCTSGCGAAATQSTDATRNRSNVKSGDGAPQHDGDVTADGYPCDVTDSLGVTTTLETRPARIVSLSPRNTELLFSVGAGEQVVGVTTYCNYPLEARERTKVGGYSDTSMSLETIVSLQPELVVADCAIHAPVVAELRQLGFAVVSLEADTFESMYADIDLLGRATGHADQARRLVSELRECVSSVADVAERIPDEERVSVLYEVWDEPLGAAGPASYLGKMIAVCGGINMVEDPESKYPIISHELVIERNPDVILTPSTHSDEFKMEDMLSRPGWGDLKAVRNGRVYVLDGDEVSRFGPRFFRSLGTIARTLYPDYFEATIEHSD